MAIKTKWHQSLKALLSGLPGYLLLLTALTFLLLPPLASAPTVKAGAKLLGGLQLLEGDADDS